MRTVGEILKEARTKKGLSFDEIEQAVKIRKKILQSLEEGDWLELPPIYLKGLLKNYSTYLGLDERRILAFFRREYDEKKEAINQKPLVKPQKSRFSLTPPMITAAAIALITIGVVTYLFFQYRSFTAAPKLEIAEPADNINIGSQEVNVVGQTWSDATLKINGEPVQISTGGAFSVAVGLKEGINTLTITASNRFGKTTVVKRTVIVQLPEKDLKMSENILRLVIEVIEKSTFVSIDVDGKNVFQGLMLAGSQKDFEALENIKIKTENAGATKIIQGDQQFILGKEGESVEKEFSL